MKVLIAIRKINSQSGFNLLEILLVTIIMGIATAVAVPSFLSLRDQNEVKKVFTQIRGALIQAQANANSIGKDCSIIISKNKVTASPSECKIDSFTIDDSVVSVEWSRGSSNSDTKIK